MTATLLRRRRVARPRILSLTNHFVVTPDGFRRDCLVQLPDGSRVIRPVRESTLLALGLVVAA